MVPTLSPRPASLPRLAVALCLAGLLGAGCTEQLVVTVDDTKCTPGCTIVTHEVSLLVEDGAGLCARRAARSSGGAELVLDDAELSGGQRYGVSVLGFCAESACPRCAGTASAAVGDPLRVELADSVGCAPLTRRVCQPALRWLPSSAAALSGRMSREATQASGALAGRPIFPDLVGQGGASTARLDLSPTDDVYVRGGTYADRALGNEPRLVITNSTLENYEREGLLRFDLRRLDPTATTRAVVRLRGAYGESIATKDRDAKFNLHAVSDDSWTEASVTYNKAPAAGAVIDTRLVLHLDFTELDATTSVLAELRSDQVASFRVISDRDRYILIPSKESDKAAQRPVLQVDRAVGLSSSADAASFSFETSAPWRWYLWARLRYPGATKPPKGDPNSFWVTVDGGAPRILGGRTDRDGAWHWDGCRGGLLPLGFLQAGQHALKIVNRQANESSTEQLSPRLDVLLLTNDPGYTPVDADAELP